TLALMLAQHLHDTSVGGQMIVPWLGFRDPGAIGDLERVLPAVRVVLIWTEEPEVSGLQIQFHDVAQEPAHHPRGFGRDSAGFRDLDGVFPEIWEAQLA